MSRTTIGALIGILLLGLVVTIPYVAKYANNDTYEITITDKEVKKDGDSSKYLIFTELEDGTGRVFENTDAWFKGKFDSSSMYGELEIGKTYKIKTIGYRIPILSIYENIVEISSEEEN